MRELQNSHTSTHTHTEALTIALHLIHADKEIYAVILRAMNHNFKKSQFLLKRTDEVSLSLEISTVEITTKTRRPYLRRANPFVWLGFPKNAIQTSNSQ